MCFVQADIVRIDHFRGFEAYWEIPATEPTAVRGRWIPGPGADFFEAMRERLGDLPIIAEDLGVITPGVIEMRERFGFPGMKILQFAFGGDQKNEFLPYSYHKECVVYTGTHDNETTAGWYVNAGEQERDFVRRYLAVSGRDIAWDMIRLAHASVANLAVVPMQDLLSLGNEARMNFPGKVGGYWRWRFTTTTFNQRFPGIARGLSDFAVLYGRGPKAEVEEQGSGGEYTAGAEETEG
jgi:4-alpha-glucanotransferase